MTQEQRWEDCIVLLACSYGSAVVVDWGMRELSEPTLFRKCWSCVIKSLSFDYQK